MLCSAIADLSVCASLICLLYPLIRICVDRPLCSILTLPNSQGMLYIPGVLNPTEPLTDGRYLEIFLVGSGMLLILCLASILLSLPYVTWVYGTYAVDVGLSFVLAVSACGFRARHIC
jgi:hypothetical protein